MNPATDREADSLAYACFVFGSLAERDPLGDPPATAAARDHAGRAGAECARAFDVLGQVRDGSAGWARRGWPVPTLAEHTMRILQRAARSEHVREDVLAPVLAAAEHVARELGSRLLTADPNTPARAKARTMRRHRPGDDIARARKASRPSTQPPTKRKCVTPCEGE